MQPADGSAALGGGPTELLPDDSAEGSTGTSGQDTEVQPADESSADSATRHPRGDAISKPRRSRWTPSEDAKALLEKVFISADSYPTTAERFTDYSLEAPNSCCLTAKCTLSPSTRP